MGQWDLNFPRPGYTYHIYVCRAKAPVDSLVHNSTIPSTTFACFHQIDEKPLTTLCFTLMESLYESLWIGFVFFMVTKTGDLRQDGRNRW